jgi:hypothetical protein
LKARLNTDRTIVLYYPPDAALVNPRVKVFDPDGVLAATINLTQSTVLANVYIAEDPYTPLLVGPHTLKFEKDVASIFEVFLVDELQVGLDPVSDFALSATASFTKTLDDSIVGDITSTVTVDVLDTTDTVLENVTAPYTALDSAYVASLSPISAEGVYLLIWYDDSVVVHVDELLGLIPRAYEPVTIEVFKTEGSAAVPHESTKVLLSRELGGLPISQDITDASGLVNFTVPPDRYIITLEKSGTVFSRNNVEFQVIDPQLEEGTNDFRLETGSFQPTFDPELSVLSTAVLFADLFNFDGTPMRDTEVLVSLAQGPENFSGNAVFGTAKVFCTDKNGHVEFSLVQGIVVTVTIMSHSVRKTITVPSGAAAATPTNLLDLMNAASDVFDIIIVDIPEPPRRTL